MRHVRHRLVAVALVGIVALAPACSGSGDGTVDVGMDEFSFSMSSSVAAGDVTFSATNEGTSVHEMKVFTVPDGADATSLPVTGGVADVDGAGLELVGGVENVAPSATADLSVTLEAGDYALICNLAGHYAAGMVTPFEVR